MSGKHGPERGRSSPTCGGANDEVLARVLEAAHGSAGAIAQRVVRNWHTAEDVVQEALLRAVVAQDHLQNVDNLEAWFRGVVRHIAVDRVRREVREREIVEALTATGFPDDVIPHRNAEAIEQEELKDLIREAMRQLGEHNRRVVELFYFRNQTLRQIADCLGVSPNTVKQRLFRARDMLKHALAELAVDAFSIQQPTRGKAISMQTTKTIRSTPTIPPGWNSFGHTENYDIRLDPKCRLTGAGSATITATGDAAEVTAGLIQRFPVAPWRARRLLARLWVKGGNLAADGFYAFLEAHDRNDVGYNVVWPRCGGTFDWKPIETVLDVPDTDSLLTIGFQLIGGGQLWVDRVELDEARDGQMPNDVRHSITWPGLTNLDFTDTSIALPATRRMPGIAPGWFGVNVNMEKEPEVVSLDRADHMTGAASARIDHRSVSSPGLNRINQRVPVDNSWRGRHLLMRGWAKSLAAERAGLWLRTDAEQQSISLDDMKHRPITGTREWTPYELVAAITPATTHVAFGSLLHGKGALWLDRVEFDVVDTAVPCTCLPVSDANWRPRTPDVNETARNLDFSESA